MLIHGGYGCLLAPEQAGAVLGDVHIFDAKSMSWSKVDLGLRAKSFAVDRFSHQMCVLRSGKVLAVGGVSLNTRDLGPKVLDLDQSEWIGVSSVENEANAFAMHQKFTLSLLPRSGLLVALGGGCLCFSFGTCFNKPAVARIDGLQSCSFTKNAIAVPAPEAKTTKQALEQHGLFDKSRRIAPFVHSERTSWLAIPVLSSIHDAEAMLEASGMRFASVWAALPESKVASNRKSKTSNKGKGGTTGKTKKTQPRQAKSSNRASSGGNAALGDAVLCQPCDCKLVKTSLEKLGFFDNSRSVGKQEDGKVAVPVQLDEEATTKEVLNKILRAALGDQVSFMVVQDLRLPVSKVAKATTRVRGGKKGAASTIHTVLCAWLKGLANRRQGVSLPDDGMLQTEVPRKIEVLGDVALVPKEGFRSADAWQTVWRAGETDQADCLWHKIAELTRASRVVLQQEVDAGVKRASRAKLVYPRNVEGREGGKGTKDAWVEVKQNGVLYGFDVEKVMFSSGNISEKQRVAGFPCRGETVVDMFAGIGYFTLPYLVKAGAAHVHACEWNADSLVALRANLKSNGVAEDRCTVHAGDCRETVEQCLVGVADRVNLGLIPSSEPFLRHGVMALRKDRGGWLHVHENVADKDRKKWAEGLVAKIEGLCESGLGGGPWEVRCEHVERVKSYSPRVNHVVADLVCRRPGELSPERRQSASCPAAEPRKSSVCYAPGEEPRSAASVPVVPFPKSREAAAELFGRGLPVVLDGFADPEALRFWSPAALAQHAPREVLEKVVSVHVCNASDRGKLSFVDKSFEFEMMPFEALLKQVLSSSASGSTTTPQMEEEDDEQQRFYYLRAIGANARKDRAHFWRDFAGLAEAGGLAFPEVLVDRDDEYHSSVIRVASEGLQLWTHYDVMRNVLFQLAGQKRMVLFQPEDVDCLDMVGSTSRVVEIDDLSGMDPDCPFARARRRALEVTLEPGQALFIPALWPHNARADAPSVAVNVFWKELPSAHYGRKDLYGNRDPVQAEKALELVERAKDLLQAAADDGSTMPKGYTTFYARKAAGSLKRLS